MESRSVIPSSQFPGKIKIRLLFTTDDYAVVIKIAINPPEVQLKTKIGV